MLSFQNLRGKKKNKTVTLYFGDVAIGETISALTKGSQTSSLSVSNQWQNTHLFLNVKFINVLECQVNSAC